MLIAHINNTSIHYRTDGPRRLPCLVLSNSLGTDLRMWDAQADALARHFHVLRYDTRGHGQSASPPGPYSLEQLGGDVLALLDHLGIERAHFCGLSMGGVTGQWLAVHAPARIDRLVLANTAARVGTADGWQSRAAAVRESGMGAVADSAASRWFTGAYVERHPESVARMVESLREQNAQGYASCCDALAAADLRGTLGAVLAPTLIIAGEHDPVTTLAHAQAMQEEIREATVLALPASHISNIEAPTEFTQAVLEFLLSPGAI
ncbi:MAG: 3-oxoadipate enol-lactonase [Pseudomonadota bacterium]